MPEKDYSQRLRLGFSGGGFRATFYCIGAYRRLVELGIHHLVTDISSVSGGSIAAGAIMLGLSEKQFSTIADFDEYVTKRVIALAQGDLRQKVIQKASALVYLVPIAYYFPAAWVKRLSDCIRSKTSEAFPTVLDETLFQGKLMKDLPSKPEWSCNATCLNTLKRFRFKPKDIYGNRLGVSRDIDDITVAFAVAASAAYPLAFAPLRLPAKSRTFYDPYQMPDCIEIPDNLYLTDGGVYDNLGSENLLKDKTPFIMLDASAETAVNDSQPSSLELSKRILAASLDQIVALRRRLLHTDTKCDGVQLILNRPIADIAASEVKCRQVKLPDYSWVDPELEKLIASIRTDLDPFHDIEIEMLMWAGAIRMDLAIRSLIPDRIGLQRTGPPEVPKYPEQQVREVLMQGSKQRIFGRVHKTTCAEKTND